MRYLSILTVIIFLGGCAAAVETVDLATPEELLQRASAQMEAKRRPLAAEELILEAMLMCEAAADDLCAARAYKVYAEFLQSPRLARWARVVRRDGFQSKGITYDGRFWHALEYWEKALAAYTKAGRFDGMRAAQYNIGLLYEVQLSNKEKACQAYKKSFASHVIFRLDYPEIPADVPDGYKNYEEYIRQTMLEAGCLN